MGLDTGEQSEKRDKFLLHVWKTAESNAELKSLDTDFLVNG